MSHTPASIESRTLAGDVEERAEHEQETPFEHLAVRDIASVHEDVDPRLSLSSRPSADELDESFPKHLQHTLSGEHPHHLHHRPHDTHHKEAKGPITAAQEVNNSDVDLEKKAIADAGGKRSQTPSSTRESDDIIYVGTCLLLNCRSPRSSAPVFCVN